MADRGIIFSAPMVRALLDGRKAQTRRLIARAPRHEGWRCDRSINGFRFVGHGGTPSLPCVVPYSEGDRLWVREHWKTSIGNDRVAPRDLDPITPVLYLADGTEREGYPVKKAGKHRQGMHMPRWASRLTLTVTEVRVQRLQEISEEDAVAEGIASDTIPDGIIPGGHTSFGFPGHSGFPTAISAFEALWNSLHTAEGERWCDNPWVVAVGFDARRGNIDEVSHD